MTSTESTLKRLKAPEADKGLLRAQLSSLREDRGQEAPRRQTVFLRKSSDIEEPIDRVTGCLTKSAEKTSHSPLLNIFTQYDRYNHVFDNIYQRLGIKDVIAVSRTCKRLSSFYRNMLPCQWNINQRLARFVDDPKEFRSRLGQADALISGTFALLFFAQLYWLDSGLDIYVQEGSKADALIRYIGEDKSYKFDHSYGWSDNDQHRTLTKAYYEAMEQILSKYSAHGWRTSDWVDYDQARGCNKPGIRENFRRIGDSSTWIVPLNLYKILQGAASDVASTGCRICAATSATSTCEKDRHRPTAIETYISIKIQWPTILQASTRQICNVVSTEQARNITSDNHAAEIAWEAESKPLLTDTQAPKSVHASTS
ncbi:hypothetical protein KCV07_g4760, partial [Aureobasidium melanogenum]